MMRSVLIATALCALAAVVVTVSPPRRQATAAPGKNLKIYPKDTDLKVIKQDMKAVSKALGVQCDFCHDLDAFDSDANKHKDQAREMMKLVTRINTGLKKDGFKAEVTCNTCHRGNEHPPKR